MQGAGGPPLGGGASGSFTNLVTAARLEARRRWLEEGSPGTRCPDCEGLLTMIAVAKTAARRAVRSKNAELREKVVAAPLAGLGLSEKQAVDLLADVIELVVLMAAKRAGTPVPSAIKVAAEAQAAVVDLEVEYRRHHFAVHGQAVRLPPRGKPPK